jgi:hypothetical protein
MASQQPSVDHHVRCDHRRWGCVVLAQHRRPRHPLRHLVRCHPDRACLVRHRVPSGCGRLWRHVRPRPTARPGPGVSDLSQQGHGAGLKRSVVPSPGDPRGASRHVPTPQQRLTWGGLTSPPLIGEHGHRRVLIHDAVGSGVRVVDGAGIRAHRWGSPRRGIYRPDACTVSRRGVAATSPGPRQASGVRSRSPTGP